MGLVLAVKGRKACFNIFLKSTVQLNIVIEIRGPEHTLCSERITNRSPKRKPPIKSSLLSSLSSLEVNSKTSRSNLGVSPLAEEPKTVKIPFEYEVMSGKVSVGYIPIVTGKHRLSIIWQGQHIMGSPYTVSVDESVDSQLDAKTKPSRMLGEQHGSLRVSTPPSTPVQIVSSKESSNKYAFFTDSRLSPSRSPTLGTVTRRRVLRHILKVDGKDMVIEDSNPEAFASAVRALNKRETIFSKRPLTRHYSLDFKSNSDSNHTGNTFPSDGEGVEKNDNKCNAVLSILNDTQNDGHQFKDIHQSPTRPRTKSAPESILRNSGNESPNNTHSARGSPKSSRSRGVSFDDESSERSMSMSSGLNSEEGQTLKPSVSEAKLCNDVFMEYGSGVQSTSFRRDADDKRSNSLTSRELKQWFKVIEEAQVSNMKVEVDDTKDLNQHTKVVSVGEPGKPFIIPAIVEETVQSEESCDEHDKINHSKDDKAIVRPKMTRKVAVVTRLDDDQIKQLFGQERSDVAHEKHDAECNSQSVNADDKTARVSPKTEQLVSLLDMLIDQADTCGKLTEESCSRQAAPVNLNKQSLTEFNNRLIDMVAKTDEQAAEIPVKADTANEEILRPSENCELQVNLSHVNEQTIQFEEVLDGGFLKNESKLNESYNTVPHTAGFDLEEKPNETATSPTSLHSDRNSDWLSRTEEESTSEEWVVVSETEEQSYVVELTTTPQSTSTVELFQSVENRKKQFEEILTCGSDDLQPQKQSVDIHRVSPIRSTNFKGSLEESSSSTQASCFPSRSRSQDSFSLSVNESEVSTFNKTKEFWEKNDVIRCVPDIPAQQRKDKNELNNSVNLEGGSSVRERRLFWENFSESPQKTSPSAVRTDKKVWQTSENSPLAAKSNSEAQDGSKVDVTATSTASLAPNPSETIVVRPLEETKNCTTSPRLGSPGSEGTADSGVSVQYPSPTSTQRRGRSKSFPSPSLNLNQSSMCPHPGETPLTLIYRQNPLFSLDSSRRYDASFLEESSVADTSGTELTDDRGYIDDEIPDYASILMDRYVSFTGLLENDHCMSRREMMGIDFRPESELFKSQMYHEPILRSDMSVHLPRPSACRARGSGVYYGQVGTRNHFQVVTRGAGKGCLTVSVQGPGQHDVNEVVVAYAGDHLYEVMYDVAEPGYYIISVKWSDWNIPESPFICKVTF